MSHLVSEKDLDEVVKATYRILLEIFFDADPVYLLKASKSYAGDSTELTSFVLDLLNTDNYPSLHDFLKLHEQEETRKKYAENFTIKDYLDEIPNPLEKFMGDKRVTGTSEPHALAFMKSCYRQVNENDIRNIFLKNNRNLSAACEELDGETLDDTSYTKQDNECIIPNDFNIAFIQEVAFIKNKSAIKEALENKKKEINAARLNGFLKNCLCCLLDFLPEDVVYCEKAHNFCKYCVRRATETQFGLGKNNFPCLSLCEAKFSMNTLQKVLNKKLFEGIEKRKQMAEVQSTNLEGFVSCPFCEYGAILPKEDQLLKCQNPYCRKISCRICKATKHVPLKCGYVERREIKKRTYIEEKMTSAMLRICFNCNTRFIKQDGCNHMRCTSCSTEMCYVCRKPWGKCGNTKCGGILDQNILHERETKNAENAAKIEAENLYPDVLKHL